MSEADFVEGYRDGYDLTCPEPSANRSNCYRHSFAIGRAEREGRYDKLPNTQQARDMAALAIVADLAA